MRLSTILDQRQLIGVADSAQGIHVARMAIKMHCNHRFGPNSGTGAGGVQFVRHQGAAPAPRALIQRHLPPMQNRTRSGNGLP